MLARYNEITCPNYQGRAALAWGMVVLALLMSVVFLSVPGRPVLWAVVVLLPFFGWRAWKGWGIAEQRLSFHRYFTTWLPVSELKQKLIRHAADVYLGFAFEWTPEFTQLAYDIERVGHSKLKAPEPLVWLDRTFNKQQSISEQGEPWIHAIGEERDTFMPKRSNVGNTLIIGTPGSGKTRMLDLFITQAVDNGDVVYILDPKGDKDLEETARRAAERNGRKFVYFHVAHAAKSVAWQPLKNFNRPTELASRIIAIVEGDDGEDQFSRFDWKVVNTVVSGLLYIGKQPSLMELKRHIQFGPDELLAEVLEVYFSKNVPGWEQKVRSYGAKDDKKRGNADVLAPRLQAMIAFYKKEAPKRDAAIDSLVGLVEHNREHYGKMIVGLEPVLEMLTAGDVGPALSPDPATLDAKKEIWDATKVVNLNAVVYVGLDNLSDEAVGSAIGSMLISEAASVAGAIYNYNAGKPKRVQVFGDEITEILNKPLYQMMNKSRGAGFEFTVATQNFADFAAKTGDSAKADMFVGNTGNLFVLRSGDPATHEFWEVKCGKVPVKTISYSQSSVSGTKEAGIHFAGNVGLSMSEQVVPRFSPQLLGKLPDLHYVAVISGGKLIKGRVPLLEKAA